MKCILNQIQLFLWVECAKGMGNICYILLLLMQCINWNLSYGYGYYTFKGVKHLQLAVLLGTV